PSGAVAADLVLRLVGGLVDPILGLAGGLVDRTLALHAVVARELTGGALGAALHLVRALRHDGSSSRLGELVPEPREAQTREAPRSPPRRLPLRGAHPRQTSGSCRSMIRSRITFARC